MRCHIRDIDKNDDTKPVLRHFISANHNINHVVVFAYSLISGTNDNHKSKEMRVIRSLGTLQPHGIDECLVSFN